MKIEDLFGVETSSIRGRIDDEADYGVKRNKRFPEVAALLNARDANMLFNCPLLMRDEMDLANFIINKLDIDPHYLPGDAVLQAVRVINLKLSQ